MFYNFYTKCKQEAIENCQQNILNWDINKQRWLRPLNRKFDYDLLYLEDFENNLKHHKNIRIYFYPKNINFQEYCLVRLNVNVVNNKKEYIEKYKKLINNKILFYDKLIEFYFKHSPHRSKYSKSKHNQYYKNWNKIKIKICKNKIKMTSRLSPKTILPHNLWEENSEDFEKNLYNN